MTKRKPQAKGAAAMSSELYIYAQPAETVIELVLDNGAAVSAGTSSANGRDDAHRLPLPSGTTGQGGVLTVTAPGHVSLRVRGIVAPSDSGGPAMFVFDDFGALAREAPPAPDPAPPRDPSQSPFDLINAVYHAGEFDLSTKEGCGTFTEAACTALNEQHSADWGHIKKNPGQNQWIGPSGIGHAIDAVMLRATAGPTTPGIYDIILSTESPDAMPAWSYKGPPDYALWYYPA
jgi:hypothetical protein